MCLPRFLCFGTAGTEEVLSKAMLLHRLRVSWRRLDGTFWVQGGEAPTQGTQQYFCTRSQRIVKHAPPEPEKRYVRVKNLVFYH